jgi:UDP-3-O-[3-hydroxymyristoyl] glucosamine N-acyltransferase
MPIRAGELARWLGAELIGDQELLLERASRIEEALPGSISFVANPKYRSFARSTQASALVIGLDLETDGLPSPVLLRVADPYASFARVLERLAADSESQRLPRQGHSPMAWIHPEASIAESAWIGPFSSIDAGSSLGEGVQVHPSVCIGRNVRVGARSVLHPGVVIYDECEIGPDCVIHAGAVIGSDGFGFAPQPDGSFRKIPQLGNVRLEAHVEIGANTTIDRATMGSTLVKSGAKIDNLVQLAHNVEVGEYSVLAAQSGVSGSTKIGRGVQIGGQAGLVGHIQIADGTRINAQSGVNRAVSEPGTAITGSPAGPYRQELKAQVIYRSLPELEARLRALEAQVQHLTRQEQTNQQEP